VRKNKSSECRLALPDVKTCYGSIAIFKALHPGEDLDSSGRDENTHGNSASKNEIEKSQGKNQLVKTQYRDRWKSAIWKK
jgi:hypothetical protein